MIKLGKLLLQLIIILPNLAFGGQMQLLTICHSTGDSTALFKVAQEAAKRNIATNILIIGTPAKNNIEKLSASLNDNEKKYIQLINLDQIFPHTKPVMNNQLILKPQEIEVLTENLKLSSYDWLLVGTPSYSNANTQCDIPGQLLKAWPHLPKALYSDYTFYEPAHHLVTQQWFKDADQFLVPDQKAIAAFKADPAKTFVVGHPAVDAMQEDIAKINAALPAGAGRAIIRNKLAVNDQQKLIFVASSVTNDEAMLQALCATCSQYPQLKIMIGTHPAAKEEYLQKLQALITQSGAKNQVSLLPKNLVTTSEAVYAADGVAALSSTVAYVAVKGKLPAVWYQADKVASDLTLPYPIGSEELAFFAQKPSELLPFYEKVIANQRAIDLTHTQSAAKEIMDKIMLLKMRHT